MGTARAYQTVSTRLLVPARRSAALQSAMWRRPSLLTKPYRGSAKLADRNHPDDSNGKAGLLSLLQGSRTASASATPRRP